jgi:hypothetical protein
MDELIGREYKEFDGKKKWELFYEGILLLIFETGKKRGRDINLLGIEDLKVKWAVGGEIDSNSAYDGITNIWVKNGFVWAGTWSGFEYRLDYKTGKICEKHFTK